MVVPVRQWASFKTTKGSETRSFRLTFLRAVLGEASEEAGQEVGGDGWDRGEDDAARAPIIGHPGARVFREAENLVGVALEHLSRVGEANAATEAFEERLAEFSLELGDLLAERRLRYMARFRGTRHVAKIGNFGKVTKLVHLHGAWIPSLLRNRQRL
jgi:hypothetical protein